MPRHSLHSTLPPQRPHLQPLKPMPMHPLLLLPLLMRLPMPVPQHLRAHPPLLLLQLMQAPLLLR
jgi:hypothetical protein